MTDYNFGVAAYTFPAGCGFASVDGAAVERPMDAFGLAALASEHGLSGIEAPIQTMLPDLSDGTLDRFRRALEAANLALTCDSGVVDGDALSRLLPMCERAGVRVLRATLSTVLEGDRARAPGGWVAWLEGRRRRIAAVLPRLRAHGVTLALENHQDATSEELISLCEAGDGWVGVTLDVSNPLAVAEEPLEFARAVGPWVRNVHLKDYRLHPAPVGYVLERCALGEGVIPFETLLPLLREIAPSAPQHIELAALHARTIRLLEEGWWESFPPCDVRRVLPVLRLAAERDRPQGEDWRTPLERGGPIEEVAAYELAQFVESVRYLRSLAE